jgi:tRNA U34 5-methylaminomethyl-2-thiouridine-forming methyltransferase MnmC
MKKVLTADKSETFVNEEYNESYHSYTGAVEEAMKKYAEPTKIRELAKSGHIRILDAFFGMGYNSAMAVSVALEENPNCKVEVVGLELDTAIVSKIQEVNPEISFFKHYKKLTAENLSFVEGNVSVKLLLGDVRETTKELENENFDVVFWDPFSPKTMPEMWSEDLFKEMFRVMKSSGVLATYSCARLGRENMSKAGLFYDDGPKVGRRGPGTLAVKWE